MGTREILTLQFGHYSNFVGAHWWNIQEASFEYSGNNESEIDHDVLFREGRTLNGQVTFTPRALLTDLNGSLKTLPECGDLYNIPESTSHLQWYPESIEVKQQEPEPKVEYQKDLEQSTNSKIQKIYELDKDIRVWSDFLYTKFHPRTVNIIKEYQHQNETVPFDLFPMGRNLWKLTQFEEDYVDKIGSYVEECDSFQGFQVLFDSFNGFGGLSSTCIEYLKDEYASKSVLAMPLIEPHLPYKTFKTDADQFKAAKRNYIGLLNIALCFEQLVENSSMFVPLSVGDSGFKHLKTNRQFHHVNYNPQLPYHSSAILAAALDTFTLSYRMKTPSYSLADLYTDLCGNGQKLSAASLCLPFCLNRGQNLIECLDNWDGPLSRSITPNCNIPLQGIDVKQIITLRGIVEDRLKTVKQCDLPAYKCKDITEMLCFYLQYTQQAQSHITVCHKGLPVKTPYPKIFDEVVNQEGNIDTFLKQPIEVESVPTLAGLHNGPFVGEMLKQFISEIKTIKFKNFHQFHTEGITEDDFNECLNQIMTLQECYVDDYLL